MANEITVLTKLTASKNTASVTSGQITARTDMSGDELLQSTQVIGTSAELVTWGEITGAPSAVHITNLDATNFLELGGDSGLTVFKILVQPLQATLIYPSSATLYAKADTASVRILKVAAEA